MYLLLVYWQTFSFLWILHTQNSISIQLKLYLNIWILLALFWSPPAPKAYINISLFCFLSSSIFTSYFHHIFTNMSAVWCWTGNIFQNVLLFKTTTCCIGLHFMRKICDNIVECRDNDITCDKWTDIKMYKFLPFCS